MKIAIAQVIHESNTFNPTVTTYAAFTIRRDREIVDYFSGAHNEITGFLEGAEANGYDALPVYSAIASPSGTVTASALAKITHDLLAALQAARPFDGILLALHGAFVSTNEPSADGELLRIARASFPSLPIVVTHDPHCNFSETVPTFADALLMYQTNPHIDQRERGLQAAKIIAAMVRGTVKPTQAFRQVPMMINIVHQDTSSPPLRDLWNDLRRHEETAGVLAASISLGYQYADVPAMGTAVCVVTDRDPLQAESIADDLATKLWTLRHDLEVHISAGAGAVALAMTATETPIVIVDIGDNVGGSATDSTFVLDELLNQGADGWVVVLCDPLAVASCALAGVGCSVTMAVGGKTDLLHGQPVMKSYIIADPPDATQVNPKRWQYSNVRKNLGWTRRLVK